MLESLTRLDTGTHRGSRSEWSISSNIAQSGWSFFFARILVLSGAFVRNVLAC